MGKTLGSILLVGAAIAINVVPGVGQAISGGIFSGLTAGLGISGFTAYGIASTVVGALTLGLTAAGIQSAGALLGLGPSIPKPDTTQTSIRVSRPPRVSAYGRSRLYFAYILYETTHNGTTVDVGAVHDGKMSGLVGFYLNDDAVTLTGNFVNEGDDHRYQDNTIQLFYTDGSAPGTPIAAIVALVPGWTNDHRGDGVVILAQIAKPVKSKKYLETYPNQVPAPSMVADWQACPDLYSATPWLESTWTWTENPIRQLLHYKLVRECPQPLVDGENPGYIAERDALREDYYNRLILPTLTYWQNSQDICDSPRPLKAGGTEPLYRSWVAHKHTDRHGEVTSALLSTCDGWISPRSDGALIVYAGKYYEPTITIGPDEITSFDWSGAGVDDDKATNEIVCSYISVNHDYTTVETTAWTDEADISRRGQLLSGNLDPQVPSWGQVRALAKRKMDRTNQPKRGTITTNPKGRIIRGERFININLMASGRVFYSGPVEITSLTRNMSSGGVTIAWVAANPDIDEWNPATEEGDAAAKGDRIASIPLPLATITSAVYFESGPNGSRVRLTVAAQDRDDLTWFVRWRAVGGVTWNENEYSDIDASPAVLIETTFIPTDDEVEVQVAYQVGDGRVSPWSASAIVGTGSVTMDSDVITMDSTNITMDRT